MKNTSQCDETWLVACPFQTIEKQVEKKRALSSEARMELNFTVDFGGLNIKSYEKRWTHQLLQESSSISNKVWDECLCMTHKIFQAPQAQTELVIALQEISPVSKPKECIKKGENQKRRLARPLKRLQVIDELGE